MPQQFCALITTPKPLSISNAGNMATPARLTLVAPINVLWHDGAFDLWNPAVAFSIATLPDHAVTFASAPWVWLLVAVKGDPTHGYLIQEHDYANLDTLLPGATWAVLYRLYGTDISLYQQSPSGTAMPAGVQGDIWRFEHGAWEKLPIGVVDDLLHVETGPYGKRPVWISVAAAGLTSTTVTPVSVGSSTTSVKMLNLWLGSSNAPEPSGWTDPAYDDSGWTPPVDVTAYIVGYGGTPLPGTQFLWAAAGTIPATAEGLFRLNFTLSAGVITSALLDLQIDDELTGCWVNNALVASSASAVSTTISLPPSLLRQDGTTNTIAIAHHNVYPPGCFVNYKLTIS